MGEMVFDLDKGKNPKISEALVIFCLKKIKAGAGSKTFRELLLWPYYRIIDDRMENSIIGRQIMHNLH